VSRAGSGVSARQGRDGSGLFGLDEQDGQFGAMIEGLCRETAEAVDLLVAGGATSLKRGVNESARSLHRKLSG
jgi:hypothetical protein